MLPIVRVGWISPRRSYFRSVCGCMPSMRAAMLMKYRSCSAGISCADPNIGLDTSRVNLSNSILGAVIAPSDFVTIGLLVGLEGLLSADNAMVLAVLVLGLPKAEQKKALRYGIIGAFFFRTVATLLAVYLIQVGWVKLVGAGYLLYLTYRHFGGGQTAEERRTTPEARPAFGLSPFWATVVKVELTDIVFAVDSILVAVAMSPKRW